jgi:CHAT domain-containing protein
MYQQKSSGYLRPRLCWCPTGAFMFLPLHAAGIYSLSNVECCADYVVSSYTPTLTALSRAQKANPGVSKPRAKLSLIAVMNAHDTNLPPLWNVEDEVRQAQATAELASIRVIDKCVDKEAVVARVAEAFKGANMVHIACHGIQDPDNALSSGFCLSDENLTVSRLMDFDLKDAFFAFLSACETAKGDENLPEQIIHLAAAMLFVGFRSIVATMW